MSLGKFNRRFRRFELHAAVTQKLQIAFLRNLPRNDKFIVEAKPSGQGEGCGAQHRPHFQFPIGGKAREGRKTGNGQ
jgi:hypothetical protein